MLRNLIIFIPAYKFCFTINNEIKCIQILTFFEVNSTLSKNRSHSKIKTGFFVSGNCFNASSFKSKLWLNSIVTNYYYLCSKRLLIY